MYFQEKNTLKNNLYHNFKHAFSECLRVWLWLFFIVFFTQKCIKIIYFLFFKKYFLYQQIKMIKKKHKKLILNKLNQILSHPVWSAISNGTLIKENYNIFNNLN
jgi:hypothetical protein